MIEASCCGFSAYEGFGNVITSARLPSVSTVNKRMELSD
jgi:hypothetical protein